MENICSRSFPQMEKQPTNVSLYGMWVMRRTSVYQVPRPKLQFYSRAEWLSISARKCFTLHYGIFAVVNGRYREDAKMKNIKKKSVLAKLTFRQF